MNIRWWFAAALLGLVMMLVPLSVQAKEIEFEFYYQKIDEVVQINNPEPKGWWEKAKAIGKDVLNAVPKLWESLVTRNYFPGEGKKTWYSSEDKNIAYKLTRVKVRDEAHLLELMGAKGDESKLTDGQKALLASYRMSKSQAVKDRLKYNSRGSLIVLMTDTSGLENEGGKYSHIRKDFWPRSTGHCIQLSSFGYNYPGSEDDARSTFIHEFSHSFDNTMKEFFKPYGADKSHYADEKTGKRAAFVEGWAQFNEMLDFPAQYGEMRNTVADIRIEDPKKAGEYTFKEKKDLSGAELTQVEGINALILYRLATEIPGGRDKVFTAFKASNYPWRDLRHLIRRYVQANPGDVSSIARIIDEETLGKLSAAELKGFLGSTSAATAAIEALRKPAEAPLPGTPTPVVSPMVDPNRPVVESAGSSPFSDR